MALVITNKDGTTSPYSEKQLRKDNPSVLFPRGLVGVNLSEYGVSLVPDVIEQPKERVVVEERIVEKPVYRSVPPDPEMVPMHCFLWGVRCFNLRTQFERYILALEGHARDYWMSAPYVSKESTYVKHFRKFFALTAADFRKIWETAENVEE